MKKIGKSRAEKVFTKGVIGTQNMKSDSSMKWNEPYSYLHWM